MTRNTHLNAALSFVVTRIEGEAIRSGKPLTSEELLLLNNLPSAPFDSLSSLSTPEFPAPMPIPRDLAYERLIALAKEARQDDLQLDPTSDRRWIQAATVCKLNRHPMSWLLRWSGVREHEPWLDRLLLIISSALLTCCFLAVMFVGIVESWTRLGWISAASGFFAVSLLLYFGSQYIEGWHLKRALEKSQPTAGQR